jgi:hypothetical protein
MSLRSRERRSRKRKTARWERTKLRQVADVVLSDFLVNRVILSYEEVRSRGPTSDLFEVEISIR